MDWASLTCSHCGSTQVDHFQAVDTNLQNLDHPICSNLCFSPSVDPMHCDLISFYSLRGSMLAQHSENRCMIEHDASMWLQEVQEILPRGLPPRRLLGYRQRLRPVNMIRQTQFARREEAHIGHRLLEHGLFPLMFGPRGLAPPLRHSTWVKRIVEGVIHVCQLLSCSCFVCFAEGSTKADVAGAEF